MKKELIIIAIFLSMTLQVAYSLPQDDRSAEYYNNAVTLFKANKYSSAILEFKKAMRLRPYDQNVKNALVSAYLARAEYYANQNGQPKNAITDIKSALYYLKYWDSEHTTDKQLAMISSVQKSLKEIEKTTSVPSQRFENARVLRMKGELQAAGYELAQLFSDNTYSKRAYENAGDIYKSLNNQLDAIASYRQAIKREPKNALLHFKYALIMDEIGNYDAAGDEYNLALKYGEKNAELLDRLEQLWLARTIENPKDAQAFVNLGTVLQKKGDSANAKAQYLKAQALDPSDKTVMLNLASLYVQDNNYIEAIKVYNSILLNNPKDIEILGYKAVAYEKTGDFKGAYKVYQSILTLDSTNKNARAAIDDIARNNFTGTELNKYLEDIAKASQNDFSAQYDYAYQMHKMGDTNQALAYYNNALKINPKSAEAYINIAQIYLSKNNFQQARATIDTALSYLPDNKQLLELKDITIKEDSAALYKTATELWEQKKYQEALALYLKIPIQTPEVLASIASCYYESGEWQKSIDYYNKVLSKKPNDTEALYLTADSYLELNNPEKAKIYLEKVVSLEPENQSAKTALEQIALGNISNQLNNAIALYEAKNYHNAILELDKVIKIDSKNAYAFYYKGLIYEEQKKIPEAKVQFERTITFDPNFTLAYYSLANLLDTQEKYADAVKYYTKFLELKKKEGTDKDEYATYVVKRNAELKDYLKNQK